MKRFLTWFSCIAVLVSAALTLPYFSTTPRAQDFSGSRSGRTQLVSTTIVINEIDYDQIGVDSSEFLELKNISAAPINLDNYTVELVNGNGGGAAIYDTIDLPNVNLAAGDYYVICANAATVVNCDLDDGPDTDFIQNGAPDAVGLRETGVLIDAVSYEGNTGAPYTETAGATVANADSGTISFLSNSRFPDGVDTDNNSVDVTLRCNSPGGMNTSAATGCTPPVSAAGVSVGGRVTTASGSGISKVRVTLSSASGVTISALTNAFGYYSFEDVTAGQTYVISVSSKGYQFDNPVRVVNVEDTISGMDFVANALK